MLRRELLADGWNDKAIHRMLRTGAWTRVRHGAYTDAAGWNALDAPGRHRLRARAVLRQANTTAALSHVSSALEHGGSVHGIPLDDVHVTRLDGHLGRHEAGVHQHCGRVEPQDVVRRHGLAVTSATRAALEVTTMADAEAGLITVNSLLHGGATDLRSLRERYASMTQWPGSLATDLVLRLADPRVESVGETRAYFLCYRQGLPAPVPQYEVRDSRGRTVARVDLAWPELGVFLEFDGAVKYEKLLAPGERASEVVLREKRREELVCRLTGWRCVRLNWADLERPEHTAGVIRDALFPRRAA